MRVVQFCVACSMPLSNYRIRMSYEVDTASFSAFQRCQSMRLRSGIVTATAHGCMFQRRRTFNQGMTGPACHTFGTARISPPHDPQSADTFRPFFCFIRRAAGKYPTVPGLLAPEQVQHVFLCLFEGLPVVWENTNRQNLVRVASRPKGRRWL